MSTTDTITAHGATYTLTAAEARIKTLEEENERFGPSDGRVTELNAIRAALPSKPAPDSLPALPYVVKQEYGMPCEHPACQTMHKHLHNIRYDSPTLEAVVNISTGEAHMVWATTGHERLESHWAIVVDDFAVDTFTTKREALAALKRRYL